MKVKRIAFTLVELLIILIIIVVATGVVIVVSKPTDILQKSRDSKRQSDLKKINTAIEVINSHDQSLSTLSNLSPNTLYLSLKDSSSTCGNYLSQLPSLPSGWSYRCSATPTDITGQGWLPIPFSSNPLINISNLLIDSINKPPYYYTFTANDQGYELTAKKENKDEEIIVSNAPIRLTPISRGGTWVKTYGGLDADFPYSIEKTSDNGYLIFGNTYSCCAGNYDIFILKLDSGGNYQWSKTIGSTYWDTVYASEKTKDGSYILGGYTTNYGAINGDVFIIKLDNNANISWAKRIGSSNQEFIYDIKQTNDGGYIAIGKISTGGNDILVLKLSNTGDLSWAKRIGHNTYSDYGYFIKELSDEGYLLTATSFGIPGVDVLIIKLDSNGDIVWSKGIGASADIFLYDGDEVDNTYLLAGWIQDNTYGGFGEKDMVILNFATSGIINWSKILGDSFNNEANFMIKTNDGGYVLVGTDIVKVDQEGNLLWSRSLKNNFYFLNAIVQNFDGSYLATGYYDNGSVSNYDISLLKLNYNGNIDKCNFLIANSFSSLSPSINPVDVSPSISSIALSVYSVNINNTPTFPLSVNNFCPAY